MTLDLTTGSVVVLPEIHLMNGSGPYGCCLPRGTDPQYSLDLGRDVGITFVQFGESSFVRLRTSQTRFETLLNPKGSETRLTRQHGEERFELRPSMSPNNLVTLTFESSKLRLPIHLEILPPDPGHANYVKVYSDALFSLEDLRAVVMGLA